MLASEKTRSTERQLEVCSKDSARILRGEPDTRVCVVFAHVLSRTGQAKVFIVSVEADECGIIVIDEIYRVTLRVRLLA